MDTNNAHPPKDMYQFPAARSEAEVFSAPLETEIPLSDEVVNQRFQDIAHEEVRLSFERITQEIALSAAGIESPYIETPEIIDLHPGALKVLELGRGVQAVREKRHQAILEKAQTKRLYKKIFSALLGERSPVSGSPEIAMKDVLEPIVRREVYVVGDNREPDKQVKTRELYYYPNEIHDEWFYQQISAVRTKNFTNSYIVKQTGFEKSSTYFDEIEGRKKNVLVIPSDAEIEDFIAAAQHYHDAVKADYDLTA